MKTIITSSYSTLGTGNGCLKSSCINLDSGLYYFDVKNTKTDLGKITFSSINLIDSSHAEVTFLPPSVGYFGLRSKTGIVSQNYLNITTPYVTFSPSSGVEENAIELIISGIGVNFGNVNTCSYKNCIDLGNSFTYFSNGTDIPIGILPFNSFKFIDSAHVKVGIILPNRGTYILANKDPSQMKKRRNASSPADASCFTLYFSIRTNPFFLLNLHL